MLNAQYAILIISKVYNAPSNINPINIELATTVVAYTHLTQLKEFSLSLSSPLSYIVKSE